MWYTVTGHLHLANRIVFAGFKVNPSLEEKHEGLGTGAIRLSWVSFEVTPTVIWSAPIYVTDRQGFRFMLRARPTAFSGSPAHGINTVAAPGYDFLDVEIQVANLLTDRRAPFTENMVGFSDSVTSSKPCTYTLCVGWMTEDDEASGAFAGAINLPARGNNSFHMYAEFPARLHITDIDFFADDCAG